MFTIQQVQDVLNEIIKKYKLPIKQFGTEST